MRFPCWITKATDTHLEYVILIAILRQQWLRERYPVLRYTYVYTACVLYISVSSSRSGLLRLRLACVVFEGVAVWTLVLCEDNPFGPSHFVPCLEQSCRRHRAQGVGDGWTKPDKVSLLSLVCIGKIVTSVSYCLTLALHTLALITDIIRA
jgi:hypothetical protein